MSWPATAEELEAEQQRLARCRPETWKPVDLAGVLTAGCFVCFSRGASGVGAGSEPGWAGAALLAGRRLVASTSVAGTAASPYRPGLLALREGPLLEAAVRGLPATPDVLVVNATGRDHPRRAGLAVHLGAVLDVPTVGVTHRPLLAEGRWPPEVRGATEPLVLEGEVVGCWLRTRARVHPLAVHPGWRTDVDTAVALVLTLARRARAPEPLRQARRAARLARARAGPG